jgi:nucleoside-diphosphate-sugar epimerase
VSSGSGLPAVLRDAGHEVSGTTRTSAKVGMLHALGVAPVVIDVFDADALARAVTVAQPDIVIHQLTDLSSAPGTPGYPAAQSANRRLRIEGTRNLMRAAKLVAVRRVIAQSIGRLQHRRGRRRRVDRKGKARIGVRSQVRDR